MKKSYIITVNVAIMAAILTFVIIYSGFKNRISYQRQIEHFEDITVTMEHVTENYLEGEQGICDVWAHYINSRTMTMEEAVDCIRVMHVHESTSAHLIATDTLTGLSTRPKQGTDDDFSVSYERVRLLDDVDWIDDIGESINITRAYTNPMNGEQSLAFCNRVSLYDPESKTFGEAILLRVIPISALEQKWVFPQTELVNADLSMIDGDGNYILKGAALKTPVSLSFTNRIIRRTRNLPATYSAGSLPPQVPFRYSIPTARNASLPLLPSRRQTAGRCWDWCRQVISIPIPKTGC